MALIYAYLFMYLIEKKSLRKLVLILLPFLVLLRICMETYTNSTGADWHLAGNAIAGAIPMVSLGYFIHIKELDVVKVGGRLWFSLLALSYALMFISVNYRFMGLDISQVFKVSTALLSFICCIKYKGVLREGFFTRLGKETSLYIYIYHFLIGVALRDIFIRFGAADSFITTFFPWIVVLLSVAVSYVIAAVKCKSAKLAR